MDPSKQDTASREHSALAALVPSVTAPFREKQHENLPLARHGHVVRIFGARPVAHGIHLGMQLHAAEHDRLQAATAEEEHKPAGSINFTFACDRRPGFEDDPFVSAGPSTRHFKACKARQVTKRESET